MRGGWDVGTWDEASWDDFPLIVDYHDGGSNRKRFAREIAARRRRRDELVAQFERLGNPSPVVIPAIPTQAPAPAAVDLGALVAEVERLEAIWAALMDEEEEEVAVIL